MMKRNLFLWSILVFTGILLCVNQKANASSWISLIPSSFGGNSSYEPPVIIERGDTTVYEFTFRGGFGASYDCDMVPCVMIQSGFAPEDVFLSLDPVELVTEKEWEVQHVNAGEPLYWWFTVYLSNPQLEPTLPDEYYKLRAAWSPYPYSPEGGIGIRSEIKGIIKMQVTPEPATLALFGLGGLVLRRRKS